MRAFALSVAAVLTLACASCAHVPPADPALAAAPWPATSPSLVNKSEPAPPEPPESKKPPIPPLKNDVVPTPPRTGPRDRR